RALAAGESRLVRIGPQGTTAEEGDVIVAESMCASEGTVEVLLEPHVPRPLLAVVGDGPAARTLRELAAAIGWRVASELADGADAVVIASMGHGDEESLTAGLASGAGDVGAVGDTRRAPAGHS